MNTGNGDILTFAIGLSLFSSKDSVVEGNVISGVSETGSSRGIQVESSSVIEVRNNTVLRTSDAPDNQGIFLILATDVIIIGNRILNPVTTGTTGIVDESGSTGINCIDNVIAGYVTAIGAGACDFDLRNDKL